MLIDFYNKLKASGKHNFELVFVSLDRTESEYNEYVSDMPWKCIPFSVPEQAKQKIAMKYGASGIPHLVVVGDGSDRKLITSEGTQEVQMDPDGANFPWKPKGFSEIWPDKFLTKDGLVDSSTLDKKHLMLYFSAHWCPPCKMFTPKLAEAYTELKLELVDDFELVFVSSDKDENAFEEYWGSMPFCALPFENRTAKNLLSKLYGVQGLPSILILGPVPEGGGDRPLINDNLRGVIESGDFSEFPFPPKPYSDLSAGADGLNEFRSLVIFCENEDDDEQKDIIDAIKKVAEKRIEADDDMKFFYATDSAGISTAVRGVIKKENKYDNVIMALLDIPDNGGYYLSDTTDITEEAIESFLANPGPRQQMTR
jgi:nucleoredoxin